MISIGKPYQCGFATLFLLAANGCTLPDVVVRPESKKQAGQSTSSAGSHSSARDGGERLGTADAGGSSTDAAQSDNADAALDAGTQRAADMAGGQAKAGSSAASGGRSGAVSADNAAMGGSGGSGGSTSSAGSTGGTSAQCQQDGDCLQRGPEFAGGRCENTQCLPNPRWRCEPPPTASGSQTRELTLPVIDALQLSKLANVQVIACNKLDYVCMQPVGLATSDKEGHALLTVPATFSGYMQQNERSDYTPALYFAEPPYNGVYRNFPLIPSASFNGLALALGASVDRTRGHAMLIVEDCQGETLGGITFTSPQADKDSTPFYVRDQIPVAAAEDTPPEGDGGYVNLPSGVAEFTAVDKKTGLMINTVSALIRAGWITTVYIRPALRDPNRK